MIRKIITSNSSYILLAALVVLFGQFMYLDASARIADRPAPKLAENIQPTTPSAIISENIDIKIENQLASAISTTPQETETIKVPVSPESELITKEVIENIETIESVEIEDTEIIEEETAVEEPEESSLVVLPILSTSFNEDSKWVLGYGGMRYLDETLEIGGNARHTATLVLLEGGNELKDYTFEMKVDWNRGASLSLIARFADYENFVSCSFVDNGAQVSIVSQENGQRISHNASPTLKTKTFEGWKDLTFGISVSGNTLSCLKEGEIVLKNTFETIPANGTAGIGLWSPFLGEGLVHVLETSVKEN